MNPYYVVYTSEEMLPAKCHVDRIVNDRINGVFVIFWKWNFDISLLFLRQSWLQKFLRKLLLLRNIYQVCCMQTKSFINIGAMVNEK